MTDNTVTLQFSNAAELKRFVANVKIVHIVEVIECGVSDG